MRPKDLRKIKKKKARRGISCVSIPRSTSSAHKRRRRALALKGYLAPAGLFAPSLSLSLSLSLPRTFHCEKTAREENLQIFFPFFPPPRDHHSNKTLARKGQQRSVSHSAISRLQLSTQLERRQCHTRRILACRLLTIRFVK